METRFDLAISAQMHKLNSMVTDCATKDELATKLIEKMSKREF